jgi:NAD(P)-dependent dehydrogenase (short-subunit alcohol dehydrogenase family)
LIAQRFKELHALIYCAAVPSSKRSIVDTSEDEWLQTSAVNAAGFVRAYVAAAPALRNGRARVVALGSDATRTVGPQNGPYTASKAALEAICLTLAKEEASFGVRINVLAPSLVDSPLADHILRLKGVSDREAYAARLPWGRMLSTAEVAQSAVSLALDPQWGYASGQTIRLSSVG